MSKNVMIIDYKYCTGCHVCEVACRQEKDIPLDKDGIKIMEIGPQQIGDKWNWDYVPVPSDYCDLCAGHIEAGEPVPCVKHCNAFCMEIVPMEDAMKRVAELGEKVALFVPKNA